MMEFYFIAALLFTLLTTHAQTINNAIVVGKVDSIYSGVLKEQRKVWVSVPNSESNALYSKQRYPVIYLLDGDAHFYSVMGMVHQMSEVNGNTLCPQIIVVGILNTDQIRDLTPTRASTFPFGSDTSWLKTSGGGENFTSFLEKELIPHIDSLYPTAPYRILIGHSFGGLMVINTLFNHTHLFNSYIAIEPSMWWDNQKVLKQASAAVKQKDFGGKTLFLALANTMKPGMDTLLIRKDTSTANLHIRSILQLASVLDGSQNKNLRWKYKYYKDDDHGSVSLISEYDGLRFIFDGYKIAFVQRIIEEDSFNIDSAIAAHYKGVSKLMGYTVLPPEPLINGSGYYFLQNKKMDKAYVFFLMNVRNYPQSFNAHDSMGDFYAAKGDKKQAVEHYTKALALKAVPETRKKLEMLAVENKAKQ